MDCMVNSNIKHKEIKLIIINYSLIIFEYLLFIIIDCCCHNKTLKNANIFVIFFYTSIYIIWDIITLIQFAKHIKLLQINIKTYIIIIISTFILQIGSIFFGIEMFNLFCKILNNN